MKMITLIINITPLKYIYRSDFLFGKKKYSTNSVNMSFPPSLLPHEIL